MNELAIASYLDRGLSDADRGILEDHLVNCSDCRRSVAEAQGFLATFRRPRRVVALGGLGGLAAAAAIALVIFRPQFSPEYPASGRVRRDAIEARALAVYEPFGRITPYPVRFTWAAAPGAVTYRVALNSAEGTPLWAASLTDTSVTLPRNVTMRPGVNYVWFADAILSDGSTRSTGLRQVGIAAITK